MAVDRISRDMMIMGMAKIVALRSTCLRKQVGCIIEKDSRPLSIGYTGAPPRMPHCLEVGCLVVSDGCIRSIHAEANALSWAARRGISTEKCSLYTTLSPCLTCAKLILSAGIERVVYLEEYRILDGVDLLHESGIKIERLENHDRLQVAVWWLEDQA